MTLEQEDPTRPARTETLIEAALGRLDQPSKVRLLTGASFWTLHADERIGLRSIVMSDGPCGAKGTHADEGDTATSLPSPTAMAATWDEALVYEIGALLASEARAKGVDVLLAPTMNLQRSPLGGRHFECFSEDPLLIGRMAVAYIGGLQDSGVAGCAKHFVCNDAETDRRLVSIEVAERPLRELYLAPFERVVRDAAPWTAMSAYNSVRGVPMSENALLDEPLKGEWGFDGLVTSDWVGTYSTVGSGAGGLDLVMPGPDGPWGDSLLHAVESGEVPEAAIDAKVRRILRLAARVGALNGVQPEAPPAAPRSQSDTATLARRTAAAGSVLLKNDGLLPLQPAALRRLAVLGPAAAAAPGQGGGSSKVPASHVVTALDGIRAALPADVEVVSLAGAGAIVGERPLHGPIAVRVTDGLGGRELQAEERLDGRMHWSGASWLLGRPVVELRGRFVAASGGRHRLGLTAPPGRITLLVDDREVLDETPADDDLTAPFPFEVVRDHVADLELADGQAVEVVACWQKAYERDLAMLTLAIEPPRATEADLPDLAEAVELARGADAAVVVVGTTDEDESEGWDRTSLALPRGQDELVERLAAVNRRTVVVVAAGSPVLMPWRGSVSAILLTWFPGQEAGHALADVLFGSIEPGGRLPTTWPARTEDVPVLETHSTDGVLRYEEGLHVGYRGWLRADVEPAFPFGHGLGYTSWEYLAADPDTVDGQPAVSVRLRNTGTRRGREVVQLYLSRPESAVERPARWLAGFGAATCDAGEEAELLIPLDRWAMRHWDVERAGWEIEPGAFELAVGRSVLDIRLRLSISAPSRAAP